MSDYRILVGDCREMLRTLPERSVQCVVTSPPYYGLRSYLPARDPRKAREIGLESRPDCLAWARGEPPCAECYVCTLRVVFREMWRVLRDDGVAFVNLGDSYANDAKWGGYSGGKHVESLHGATGIGRGRRDTGLKPKDLIGVPWRVAFALQADGWTLRSDIVWAKPNPMPESVEDRPTKAHEYVFLLTKRARYFWDAEAVREADAGTDHPRNVLHRPDPSGGIMPEHRGIRTATGRNGAGRNIRSVWTITTTPYRGAHFATFPPELAERCILAGTSERGCCPECGAPWERVVERCAAPPDRSQRSTAHYDTRDRYGASNGGNTGFDKLAAQMRAGEHGIRTIGWRPTCDCDAGEPEPCTVLDPFAGSGTVGAVAIGHGRRAILIDLNPQYADMMRDRCGPLLEAPTPEVA